MIIGHQKQWRFLVESAKINKLPHALLFSGPEKIGKKTLALEFLSYVFKSPLKNHPDFIFLSPINEEIKISQIKELISKISLKRSFAPFKGVIIDRAHLMNFQAQNCFLKTLEEPLGKTVFILITENEARLLPTILSRCQIIKFFPLPQKEIEKIFKERGFQKETAEKLAEFCSGRPGVAFDLISSPQKIKFYKKTIFDLISLFEKNLDQRFQYVKEITENCNEILKIWLFYLRDILKKKLEGREPEKFKNLSLKRLKNIIEFIQETFFLTSNFNINKKLALENLMLKL